MILDTVKILENESITVCITNMHTIKHIDKDIDAIINVKNVCNYITKRKESFINFGIKNDEYDICHLMNLNIYYKI